MKTFSMLVGVVYAFGIIGSATPLEWYFEYSGGVPAKLVWIGEVSRSYDLWSSPDLATWTHADGYPRNGTGSAMVCEFAPGSNGYFKIVSSPVPPGGFALIPAGDFEMGDSFGEGTFPEVPVHSVYVSAFHIQTTEVTNDQMVEVLNWAIGLGKLVVTTETVKNAIGDQREILDLDDSDCRISWDPTTQVFELKAKKAAGYPCIEVTWYGAVSYCNYRSEMEGLGPCYSLNDWSCDFMASGYRLPTEAEWEKAARGGLTGKRFPCGDTITHDYANYGSSVSYNYDVSLTRGYHPDWDQGGLPYMSTVGSLLPNSYGLHDMAGNVSEWCWDFFDTSYYSSSPERNPYGPARVLAFPRVVRGGMWNSTATGCRVSFRYNNPAGNGDHQFGFRPVRK